MKTSLIHPKKSRSSKARRKPERGCVRSTSRSASKRGTVSGLIGRSRVHSPAAAGRSDTAAPRRELRASLPTALERDTLFKRLPWSYAQGQRLSVTAPGVPKNYPDANKLVTEDCIRPMAH